LAKKAKESMYIVSKNRTRIGIGCPLRIYETVLKNERNTRKTRKERRDTKQKREIESAELAIRARYPNIPADANKVLSSWRVGSGRVGRTRKLSMGEKVRLAVQAFARHEYTNYDALLLEGSSRIEARKKTRTAVLKILDEWKGPPNTSSRKQPEKRMKNKKRPCSNIATAAKSRAGRNLKRSKGF
jgi:hypothetical protein